MNINYHDVIRFKTGEFSESRVLLDKTTKRILLINIHKRTVTRHLLMNVLLSTHTCRYGTEYTLVVNNLMSSSKITQLISSNLLLLKAL